MSEVKTGTLKLLRSAIVILASISIVLFLITATVMSLFGHSLWNWLNVLRFGLGVVIVLVVICYFFILKKMLKVNMVKKKN